MVRQDVARTEEGKRGRGGSEGGGRDAWSSCAAVPRGRPGAEAVSRQTVSRVGRGILSGARHVKDGGFLFFRDFDNEPGARTPIGAGAGEGAGD